jgi:uncharacterized protein with HEPN domain
MKKDDNSSKRFREILLAIARINEYVSVSSWEEFEKNSMLQDAILFQFAIINDAIQDVDVTYLEKYDYPWYLLKTYRKLLRHDNFNIKQIAVWNTIKDDMADLDKSVRHILTHEF